MSNVADRMRQYRARKAMGRLVLAVEVCETEHVAFLIAARLLDPNEADNREAITAATERALEILAKEKHE